MKMYKLLLYDIKKKKKKRTYREENIILNFLRLRGNEQLQY